VEEEEEEMESINSEYRLILISCLMFVK